jgi:hypothetical protein
MRREIVFVHVPKCGGTSIRTILEQTVDRHCILRDYGDSHLTTRALQEINQRGKTNELREHFEVPGRGILLSGHFSASKYWGLFKPGCFVTFLRHPVDRVFSQYAHFVNRKGWTDTFEAFLKRRSARNGISRMFEDVDAGRMGFIGFSEEFDPCLNALGRFLGEKLRFQKTNVGNYAALPEGFRQIAKHRSMIEELNSADMLLYKSLHALRGNGAYAFRTAGGSDTEAVANPVAKP